jgi:hypothetical protein
MHNNCYVMPGICLGGQRKPVENVTKIGRFPAETGTAGLPKMTQYYKYLSRLF